MVEIANKVEKSPYADLDSITLDNFVEVYHEILKNTKGYNDCPISVAKVGLLAMKLMEKDLGITGFQASFALWEVIKEWQYSNNKTGLRLIDYDNMLYPQYQRKFEKVISKDVWKSLQEAAKENLDSLFVDGVFDENSAAPNVVEHWKSIVNGVVPFGYCVEE